MMLSQIIKDVASGRKPVKKTVVITVTRFEEGGAVENAKGLMQIQRYEDGQATSDTATITCSTFLGAIQSAREIRQTWYRLTDVHDIQVYVEGQLE